SSPLSPTATFPLPSLPAPLPTSASLAPCNTATSPRHQRRWFACWRRALPCLRLLLTPSASPSSALSFTVQHSHFALASEEVIRMLEESCISVIISTNTHPISMHPSVAGSKPSKFRILDVSPIFGEAIMKLMHE
ncbi:unnamed protein product, partial [Closterium sp. NIES-54]